jgi:hypothetical protein
MSHPALEPRRPQRVRGPLQPSVGRLGRRFEGSPSLRGGMCLQSRPAAPAGTFSRVSRALQKALLSVRDMPLHLAMSRNLQGEESLRANYLFQVPAGHQGGMQQKRTRPGSGVLRKSRGLSFSGRIAWSRPIVPMRRQKPGPSSSVFCQEERPLPY